MTREKQYKKIAAQKAKEYIRNKRRYKTKAEKKAFKIAEKYRIGEWKATLCTLAPDERAARMKAYRYYKFRVNMLLVLISLGVFALLAIAAAIIIL